MRKPHTKPSWQLKIARERIAILFDCAGKEFPRHPERAHRYVELAQRIGKRYTITLGSYKRRFCGRCGHYLQPGVNARARTNKRQRAVLLTCADCGHINRHPYRREKMCAPTH